MAQRLSHLFIAVIFDYQWVGLVLFLSGDTHRFFLIILEMWFPAHFPASQSV